MTEGAPLLRAESLSFAYGPRRALDDVSLALRAGEIVAVSGPNGSGKSTLLRVLAGLLPAEGGKVFVDGEEVRADDAATRAKVGYAPQRAAVWPDLTPYEQLVFLAECHGLTKADAAVRSALLLDAVGLAPRARQRAGTLSGGMQQRVSVAMALVHKPRVVLLDEPEAGVDAASLGLLRALLKRLAEEEGALVAYATHDEDGARDFATANVRLERGHLVGARAFAPTKANEAAAAAPSGSTALR